MVTRKSPHPGIAFVVVGSLLLGACSDMPSSTTSAAESTLRAAARTATTAFQDPSVAISAGYRATTVCESSSTGGMGFHYNHPALLGVVPGSSPLNGTDAVIDPARPEVLLYEPQADGTVRLVGVEYVVFRAAWDAVNSAPPTLAGVPFEARFGANAHGISDHYELHAWVWRDNPLGMFSAYNPQVLCRP